jgi:beta-mannosidase
VLCAVWGGGRYQPDAFYEMAARLGLMVWQEMIFACALYPRDDAFLALVDAEVREQVRCRATRTWLSRAVTCCHVLSRAVTWPKHHRTRRRFPATWQVSRLATQPAIVVWGGNNENEAALNWYAESRTQRDLYVTDYVKLYMDTVMPAVRAADADRRPAVDTSPSNGLVGTHQPLVKRWGVVSTKRDASAGSWGDIHYYNYAADCEEPDTYPLARFVSEHGFQSFPAAHVYASVTAQSDWSREAPLMEHRMRHPDGNAQALAQMARHYRVPPASVSPTSSKTQAELFDAYLWLTQLQQARCYETAFGVWRRLRSEPANTMGILYWQLNAIWQGPDWSTIEYDGRLRLAHHFARRAFAPLLLSAVRDEPSAATLVAPAGRAAVDDDVAHWVSVHLSNDALRRVEGTLRVSIHRWADAPAQALAQAEQRVAVDAASSHAVWRLDLGALLRQSSTSAPLTPRTAFARLAFVPASDGARRRAEAADAQSELTASYWLAPFRTVELPEARPRILHVAQLSPTSATVQLASNVTAAFVTVECRSVVGAFSDAGFLLLAGHAPVTLTFVAQAPFALDAFAPALSVRSLRDTYE